MAHYALLNYDNIVTDVITGKNENDQNQNMELVYQDIFKQVCKRTSYNTIAGNHINSGTPFRKNFAGVGYTYDESKDAFIPPKPFDSWVLNETSCIWEAPVALPSDNNMYDWDEDNQQWTQIT